MEENTDELDEREKKKKKCEKRIKHDPIPLSHSHKVGAGAPVVWCVRRGIGKELFGWTFRFGSYEQMDRGLMP